MTERLSLSFVLNDMREELSAVEDQCSHSPAETQQARHAERFRSSASNDSLPVHSVTTTQGNPPNENPGPKSTDITLSSTGQQHDFTYQKPTTLPRLAILDDNQWPDTNEGSYPNMLARQGSLESGEARVSASPRSPSSSIASIATTQQSASPEPNQRRGHGRQSFRSGNRGRRGTRPPCKKYTYEEAMFIWYARLDLSMEWKDVLVFFNEVFSNRKRATVSGPQCRFYRVLEAHGVPHVRSLKNGNDTARFRRYTVVKHTRHRFPWMLPQHRRR